MQQTNFSIVRGDTFSKRLTIVDAAGTPIDVSAWTFAGQVRVDPDSISILGSISFDMALAATGIVDATIAANTTATFPASALSYDIQATTPSVRTLLLGRLIVIADTTR